MMMDRQRSMEFKVGIFVLAGTVLLAMFILMLGGSSGIFQRSIYLTIKAPDSLGLSPGSIVKVAGVAAGNVSEVSFVPGESNLDIVLRVERRFQKRLTKGSVVNVFTQGALGDKYVDIEPGPMNAPLYENGDVIESEIGGDLFAKLGKSGDRFETIFQIFDNINALFKSLNEGNIGTNLAETVRNLKKATAGLDGIIGSGKNNNLEKSLAHLTNILEKIDKGKGTLGSLINDPTVHEDLKSLLGGAKRNKLLKYLIRQTIQESEQEEKPVSKK